MRGSVVHDAFSEEEVARLEHERFADLERQLSKTLAERDRHIAQLTDQLAQKSALLEQAEANATEVKARESELAAVRLLLADTENGCAKGKAEGNQNVTGLANTDEDRVVHRLMKRMQDMEAEIASLRWNDKSFETMECRNEE